MVVVFDLFVCYLVGASVLEKHPCQKLGDREFFCGAFNTNLLEDQFPNFRFPSINLVTQPIVEDIYNVDAYFNQANFNAGLFSIETFCL